MTMRRILATAAALCLGGCITVYGPVKTGGQQQQDSQSGQQPGMSEQISTSFIGNQFNLQHITLAGYEKDTQTPADELAASRTARAAVFIRNDPARPTQTGELVDMLPAPKGKRFTTTEQQTLLSHGVATAYVESGALRIQRDITTYRKNAYGVADNSYLDSETLHTSAYVLRRLKSVITSKYGRHKLANDGTRFGSGQAIVTPAVIRGEPMRSF